LLVATGWFDLYVRLGKNLKWIKFFHVIVRGVFNSAIRIPVLAYPVHLRCLWYTYAEYCAMGHGPGYQNGNLPVFHKITRFLYSRLWIFRYILHSRLQNFADTPPWNSRWSATRNQTRKYITETSFRASHVTACRTHCSGGCPNTADYAHRRNAALKTETVTGPKSFFTQVFLRPNIAFSSTHYHKPYCMSDCLQKRQFNENSSC
jgi:hypothetical protein